MWVQKLPPKKSVNVLPCPPPPSHFFVGNTPQLKEDTHLGCLTTFWGFGHKRSRLTSGRCQISGPRSSTDPNMTPRATESSHVLSPCPTGPLTPSLSQHSINVQAASPPLADLHHMVALISLTGSIDPHCETEQGFDLSEPTPILTYKQAPDTSISLSDIKAQLVLSYSFHDLLLVIQVMCCCGRVDANQNAQICHGVLGGVLRVHGPA